MLFLLKLASTTFSEGFHSEEKALNKKKQLPIARKSVFTNQNEGFCWKYFSTRWKKTKQTESLRNGAKMVSTSQKISCPLAGIIFPK